MPRLPLSGVTPRLQLTQCTIQVIPACQTTIGTRLNSLRPLTTTLCLSTSTIAWGSGASLLARKSETMEISTSDYSTNDSYSSGCKSTFTRYY